LTKKKTLKRNPILEFTILLNLSNQEAHIYIATVAGYRGALTGAQNHRKFRKISNQVENLATLEDPMPLRIQHSRIGLHYTEKVQSRSENHHVILTSTLYIRSASATAAAVPVSSRTVSEGDSFSDFMRKKEKKKRVVSPGASPVWTIRLLQLPAS